MIYDILLRINIMYIGHPQKETELIFVEGKMSVNYAQFCFTSSWFHKDGSFSVHTFTENYISIPQYTGTVRFLETVPSATGDFMKKVPTATCALRDRQIFSTERVHTTSTFYMKSSVPVYSGIDRQCSLKGCTLKEPFSCNQLKRREPF